MKYETWHWRIYNLCWRLFSLALVGAGTSFIVTGLHGATSANGAGDGAPAWIYLGLGAGVGAIGIVLCRRRTYRPDLGDVSWWAGKAGGYHPDAPQAHTPRSWWTGEPRQLASHVMPNER